MEAQQTFKKRLPDVQPKSHQAIRKLKKLYPGLLELITQNCVVKVGIHTVKTVIIEVLKIKQKTKSTSSVCILLDLKYTIHEDVEDRRLVL